MLQEQAVGVVIQEQVEHLAGLVIQELQELLVGPVIQEYLVNLDILDIVEL